MDLVASWWRRRWPTTRCSPREGDRPGRRRPRGTPRCSATRRRSHAARQPGRQRHPLHAAGGAGGRRPPGVGRRASSRSPTPAPASRWTSASASSTASTAARDREPGTGLGLAIVKAIAERHGASHARRRAGGGLAVRVASVRRAAAPAPAPDRDAARPKVPLRRRAVGLQCEGRAWRPARATPRSPPCKFKQLTIALIVAIVGLALGRGFAVRGRHARGSAGRPAARARAVDAPSCPPAAVGLPDFSTIVQAVRTRGRQRQHLRHDEDRLEGPSFGQIRSRRSLLAVLPPLRRSARAQRRSSDPRARLRLHRRSRRRHPHQRPRRGRRERDPGQADRPARVHRRKVVGARQGHRRGGAARSTPGPPHGDARRSRPRDPGRRVGAGHRGALRLREQRHRRASSRPGRARCPTRATCRSSRPTSPSTPATPAARSSTPAGEVIGINSQIYSQSGGYMGLSFAIPIDVAMKVEGQLLAHGKVTRGRWASPSRRSTRRWPSPSACRSPTARWSAPSSRGARPQGRPRAGRRHPLARRPVAVTSHRPAAPRRRHDARNRATARGLAKGRRRR